MSDPRSVATIPPDPQYVPGQPALVSGLTAQPRPAIPLDGTPTISAPPAAARATPPITSSGRLSVDQIADYLANNNQLALTPQQARGAARWMVERESGGDPNAYNPAGGGAGAYGLEQARGARQRAMLALYGPTPTAQQQLDFMAHELVTSEKGALQAIRSASTEKSAYDAMGASFERPGINPGHMQAGALPDYQAALQRREASMQQEREGLQRISAEADRAAPGSAERHAALHQAMEHSERLARTFEDMAAHPPTEKPLDMMQNFGSLATVVAALGGLFARRPLTAALNAAGSAMQAQQSSNHEQFERSYRQWQDQTALVSRAISFQNQEINQIIEDTKLSEAERRERLEDHFRIWDMQYQLGQAQIGNWENVYKAAQSYQKVGAELDHLQAQTAAAHAQAERLRSLASGGGAGNTFADRQTESILEVRAKELGTTVDVLKRDHPEEVVKARTEASRQIGESRSPFAELKVQQQANRVQATLDEGDKVIKLINEKAFSVGLGGKIFRPVESIQNLLHASDDTTRRQIESNISLLQEAVMPLISSRGRYSALDDAKAQRIIRGLNMGDTIQNTIQAIKDAQDFLIDANQTLLDRYGPPSGGAASPSGSSESQPSVTTMPAPGEPWENSRIIDQP